MDILSTASNIFTTINFGIALIALAYYFFNVPDEVNVFYEQVSEISQQLNRFAIDWTDLQRHVVDVAIQKAIRRLQREIKDIAGEIQAFKDGFPNAPAPNRDEFSLAYFGLGKRIKWWYYSGSFQRKITRIGNLKDQLVFSYIHMLAERRIASEIPVTAAHQPAVEPDDDLVVLGPSATQQPSNAQQNDTGETQNTSSAVPRPFGNSSGLEAGQLDDTDPGMTSFADKFGKHPPGTPTAAGDPSKVPSKPARKVPPNIGVSAPSASLPRVDPARGKATFSPLGDTHWDDAMLLTGATATTTTESSAPSAQTPARAEDLV